MEQLKFDFFEEPNKNKKEKNKKEKNENSIKNPRSKKLPTGEIISKPEYKIKGDFLYIRFLIEKPDGVVVEKIFVFNFKKPEEKPKISNHILYAPAGLRPFDSPEAFRTYSEVSEVAFKKIIRTAYAIFRKYQRI
jgi:hypothetical protein